MKSPNEDKLTEYILVWLGVIPVIWAALTVAPFLSDGLAGIVKGLTRGMNSPIIKRHQGLAFCEQQEVSP